MKTWISYILASFLGLSITLLFLDVAGFSTFIAQISAILMNTGLMFLFIMTFFSLSSAVASLKRDSLISKVAFKSLFWTFITALILPLIAALIYKIYPQAFLATSTSSASTEVLDSIQAKSIFTYLSESIPANAFISFVRPVQTILPIFLLATLIGFSIDRKIEVLQPTYIIFNSFTETLYRIVHRLTQFIPFALIFISSSFFVILFDTGVFFPKFFSFFAFNLLSFLLLAFLFIPLVFALLTGFKINPYKILIRTIAAMLGAFFTSNALFASSSLMVLSRKNLGIMKKSVGLSNALYSMISKAGSASIATITSLSIIYLASSKVPDFKIALLIAISSFLFSFISAASLGYEFFFISILSLRMLGLNLGGAEMALVAFIPYFNALGSFLDVEIWAFGNYFAALEPISRVASEDLI